VADETESQQPPTAFRTLGEGSAKTWGIFGRSCAGRRPRSSTESAEIAFLGVKIARSLSTIGGRAVGKRMPSSHGLPSCDFSRALSYFANRAGVCGCRRSETMLFLCGSRCGILHLSRSLDRAARRIRRAIQVRGQRLLTCSRLFGGSTSLRNRALARTGGFGTRDRRWTLSRGQITLPQAIKFAFPVARKRNSGLERHRRAWVDSGPLAFCCLLHNVIALSASHLSARGRNRILQPKVFQLK
jgi:hypothetical protein